MSKGDSLQDELAALRREQQRANEREAAVRDVTQAIARTTFDLDAVLQSVVDRAVELRRADNGGIARREGDVYRVVAFRVTKESDARRSAVADVWVEDGRYLDPLADVTGHNAISELIGAVQARHRATSSSCSTVLTITTTSYASAGRSCRSREESHWPSDATSAAPGKTDASGGVVGFLDKPPMG